MAIKIHLDQLSHHQKDKNKLLYTLQVCNNLGIPMMMSLRRQFQCQVLDEDDSEQ